MTAAAAQQSNVRDFSLTPDAAAGEVPANVIEELRILRNAQNEAAADFREALKVQAGKHKVKAKALKRYVNALAADKLDETQVEVEQVLHLIESAKG
jgi:hypothetical protein